MMHVIISIDGKIITDPTLLEKFNIFSLSFFVPCDFEKTEEFLMIILPIILGGYESRTITGALGDFLKVPITFSLVKKKVKQGVCYLRYRRNASNKEDKSHGGRSGI